MVRTVHSNRRVGAWAAGDALFFATLLCRACAPDFFLALLVRDEFFERCQLNEPEAVNLASFDDTATGEARDVVRREVDDACGASA